METLDEIRGEDHARAAHVGRVGLVVRDLARVARFYRDAIGLDVIEEGGGEATLGAAGTPLLHLREDPAARADDPRAAGLFHTAFLLPARADLGRWLRHAAATRVPLEGASDHLVSEALYLADPEGNGIEIYVDRPREAWEWQDGQVVMDTRAIDLEALAAAAGGSWDGAPEGTRVGHIHLRIGDLKEGEAFYGGTLGLDLVCRYPGALFYSREGYHHHVGANVWRSRGAGRRDPHRAGLDWFELALDPAGYDAAAKRLGGAAEVEDPWGTRIRLTRAA